MSANHIVVLLAVDFAGLPRCVKSLLGCDTRLLGDVWKDILRV